jgi:hypothetical protein
MKEFNDLDTMQHIPANSFRIAFGVLNFFQLEDRSNPRGEEEGSNLPLSCPIESHQHAQTQRSQNQIRPGSCPIEVDAPCTPKMNRTKRSAQRKKALYYPE